jgi:hypothetical protein
MATQLTETMIHYRKGSPMWEAYMGVAMEVIWESSKDESSFSRYTHSGQCEQLLHRLILHICRFHLGRKFHEDMNQRSDINIQEEEHKPKFAS